MRHYLIIGENKIVVSFDPANPCLEDISQSNPEGAATLIACRNLRSTPHSATAFRTITTTVLAPRNQPSAKMTRTKILQTAHLYWAHPCAIATLDPPTQDQAQALAEEDTRVVAPFSITIDERRHLDLLTAAGKRAARSIHLRSTTPTRTLMSTIHLPFPALHD